MNNKKIVIKNPILLAVTIVPLALLTLLTMPVTKLLSKFFPKHIEASLKRGLVIKYKNVSVFSMTWER